MRKSPFLSTNDADQTNAQAVFAISAILIFASSRVSRA
ncbi:hypothetical protein [Polaromonas sp. CG9_12]|nr:hypothetical protein [Polaromonas sp. CG9_12]